MKPASPPRAAYSTRTFLARVGKAIGVDVVANGLEKARSRGDHAAAEEHDIGIDRVHQAHGTHGEVACGLAHQAAGQRIAGDRRLVDGTAGELISGDLPQKAGERS